MNKQVKVGPITMALGLIIFGIMLLLGNFTDASYFNYLWKLWPLLLIGLGVEFIVRDILRRKTQDTELKFSWASLILIFFMIGIGFTANIANKIVGAANFEELINLALKGNNASYSETFEKDPIQVKGDKVTFKLDNKVGEVKLEASDDYKVYIKGEVVANASNEIEAQRKVEAMKVDVEVDSKENILVKTNQSESFGLNNNLRVDFTIALPKGIKIDIENGVGKVTAENIAGELKINNNVGKITVENLEGNLKVVNDVGEINIDKVSGTINLRTETGRVTIVEPGAEVEAHTSTGQIELKSSQALESDNYELSTNTGKIKVSIPKESSLKVNASSNAGGIKGPEGFATDSKGASKTMTGTIGSGEGTMKLRTEVGAINLELN